jgi:hypothetical protein
MVGAVVKQNALRGLMVTAMLVAAVAPAAAHPETSPLLLNRYISLMAMGEKIDGFFYLVYGEVPGAEQRRAMDQDKDGRLSPGEQEQAKRAWHARTNELLDVSVDGKRLSLDGAKVDVQLGGDETVTTAPLIVEVYVSWPLEFGTRTLSVAPKKDFPRLGETEIVLDLSTEWQLLSSQHGDEKGIANRFKFEGPRGSDERRSTFVIASVASSGAPILDSYRKNRLMLGLALGALGAAFIVYSRRRQKAEERAQRNEKG